MFDGFETLDVDAAGVRIHLRRAGSGPPLLLLHGYPQTHVMWHAVAPALAEDFTVVVPDLRGYGASDKPPTTADHWPYTKRAMARDQVAVMRALGLERFSVCGHDRGARVGYRMALDHPERVERLAVIDIVPTGEVLLRADRELGLGYYHWFFLAQPPPLPERLHRRRPRRLLHALRPAVLRPRGGRRVPAQRRGSRGDPRDVRGLPRGGDARLRARPRGPHPAAEDRVPAARPLGRAVVPRSLVRRARDLARVGGRRHRPSAGLRALRRGGAPEETLAELRAFFASPSSSPS